MRDGTADVGSKTETDVDGVSTDGAEIPALDHEVTGNTESPGSEADAAVASSAAAAAPRRKQRVTRWDRPPEPRDWRFFVGHLGRILIVTGLLMFGFVAYQLWGTGIQTARAQNRLDDQFQEIIAAETAEVAEADRAPNVVSDEGVVVDPTSDGATFRALPFPTIIDETGADRPATPYETVVPVEEQNLPEVVEKEVLGRIEIPSITVDYKFVTGVTHEALKQGVGYFPDTTLPGTLGNSALAGHRTTYAAPFGDLDKVNVGDDIVITLTNGEQFTYVITGSTVVNPSDYWVISDSDPNLATLTLVTCTPKTTSRYRLVVFAELDPTRSGSVGQAVIPQLDPAASVLPDEPAAGTTPATAPATTAAGPTATTAVTASTVVGEASPATTAVAATPATTPATTTVAPVTDGADAATPTTGDAFSGSWFDDTAAWPHIIGWGALLALIAFLANRLSRKTRHDTIGIAAGFVPFVVVLYFFYENVNRLLPPGL